METTFLNAAIRWLEIYSKKPQSMILNENQAMVADLWAAAEVVAREKCEEELKLYMQYAIDAENALDEFRDAIAKALDVARVNDYRRWKYGKEDYQRKSESEVVSEPSGDLPHMQG